MLVVLNHKMNLTYDEVISYEKKLNDTCYKETVVVCPSSLYLSLFKGDKYALGSQDVSCFSSGSHTGDVSSDQLKSLNVSHCIVGHSERREYHKEQNKEINEKIIKLLDKNITPILCIGETEEERNTDKFKEVLLKDLEECFINLDKEQIEKIVVAYEPIWAIGTGRVPTNKEIEEVINLIKTYVKTNYDAETKVLYGGSVNEKNYQNLKSILTLDGFLIGGLSLKIDILKELLTK